MKSLKVLLLLTGIIAFGNCTQKSEPTEAEKLIISEEIQLRVNGYPEALKNKDLDWFQEFWSNEEGFVFAGDGQIETNYDAAITQPLKGLFPNLGEVLHFEFTNGQVYVLGSEAATYAANFNWGVVMNSGDTLKAKGSWLYVFRKSEDQWRVINSAGTHTYYK